METMETIISQLQISLESTEQDVNYHHVSTLYYIKSRSHRDQNNTIQTVAPTEQSYTETEQAWHTKMNLHRIYKTVHQNGV